MAKALGRIGHAFTVRASRDKTQAALLATLDEDVGGVLLLDKGSLHAAPLAARAKEVGRPLVVIDHHSVGDPVDEHDGFAMVNPRLSGLDGSHDACSSTTAVAVALALAGPDCIDLAPSALVGAIGDWQHVDGWQGWNLEILQGAKAAGHIVPRPAPRLGGGPLAPALARFSDPPFDQQGDVAAAAAWLAGLGLDPDAPIDLVEGDDLTRLTSALVAQLVARGEPTERIEALMGELPVHQKLGVTLRAAFGIVDACAREERSGLGLAFLMGDRSAASSARGVFDAYRQALRQGLEELRAKGTTRLRAIQWAWTRRHAYTGMVAGLGMMHALPQPDLPAVVMAKRPDGLVQASARGLAPMVDAGLDLGAAMATAAAAAGGEGGGHPVAAGAVVPEAAVETFLAALDEALA